MASLRFRASEADAGRRLKEARVRAELSQRQLAFPGCSAAYISRVEAGTRIASSRILEVHGERMVKRTFTPGFRIELHQKDLNLALASARAVGIFLPNTATAQEINKSPTMTPAFHCLIKSGQRVTGNVPNEINDLDLHLMLSRMGNKSSHAISVEEAHEFTGEQYGIASCRRRCIKRSS